MQQRKFGRVIVLFGGKGAGKSTYIKRLLLHNPPEYIQKKTRVVVVDLLNVTENPDAIEESIWSSLINDLDDNDVLSGDRALLLRLFQDRYDIAQNQDLFGLEKDGEQNNIRLNSLVSEWKKNYPYVANRLSKLWKLRNKGIVLIIDNTDQFSSDLQDFCFVTAQGISKRIGTVTVLSMREERFRDSKIHGLLDAFQNSGFHIKSPSPPLVFSRRIKYAQNILRGQMLEYESGTPEYSKLNNCVLFLDTLSRQFTKQNSAISEFFNACSHGNIRLALELLVNFLVSGYTATSEMISVANFTISVHQILKPVMVPNRFFYDENNSDVPNLFKVRT